MLMLRAAMRADAMLYYADDDAMRCADIFALCRIIFFITIFLCDDICRC